jgi:hypothetical protein
MPVENTPELVSLSKIQTCIFRTHGGPVHDRSVCAQQGASNALPRGSLHIKTPLLPNIPPPPMTGVSLVKLKRFRRRAMWFALLIKTLGVEPIPFQHRDYRDYAAALQQQYQKLRAHLGPAIGAQAIIAARTQMTKHTLSWQRICLLHPIFQSPSTGTADGWLSPTAMSQSWT